MGACNSQDSASIAVSPSNGVSKPMKKGKHMQQMPLNKHSKMLYEMIKDIPCISGLPDQTKRMVALKLKQVEFAKGQVIMKQGESGNKFYLIEEGACNVYSREGKLLSTLRGGDYMGEQALIHPNSERTATIKAVSAMKCFVLDNATFQNMTRSGNLHFIDRKTKGQNIFDENEDDIEDSDEMTEDSGVRDPALTDETLDRLCEVVKDNILFTNIPSEDLKHILSKVTLKLYPKNVDIITQGDNENCDEFYILDGGSCEILKNGAPVARISNNTAFGEMALAYKNPRSATVRTLVACQVWVLRRAQFQRTLRKVAKQTAEERVAALQRVPLLRTLNSSDLSKFAETLERVTYPRGHEFFRQGDVGDKFYVLTQGLVQGCAMLPDGSEKHFELEDGEFFGELALRTNKPRSATIVAGSREVVCLVAGKRDFDELFGSFDNAMERQVEEYQRPNQSAKEYRTEFLMNRSLADFESGPIIGRGKYGLVQFVRDPKSETVYALKSVKKSWVRSKNIKQSKRRIDTLFNERNVMRALNNSSFLVKLRGTFKNEESVYFLMEAAMGGDFFNVLKMKGYVDEKTARFYVACLVEGLDYMHGCNIIHRDLKPENIVLTDKGYGQLTDFGFAKMLPSSNGKTYTMCGTPGYLAPEIILGQGYGKGSDWFALGCVMFDLLTGAPPFPTRTDQFSMIQTMMNNKLTLPMYLSFWAKDLLRNLIQLKPIKRFGVVHGGTDKIRNHKWFEGFDWEALRNGTMPAPIRPKLNSAMDSSNFDCDDLEAMSKELDSQHDHTPLPKKLANWDLTF